VLLVEGPSGLTQAPALFGEFEQKRDRPDKSLGGIGQEQVLAV
jgi:hypothetical protein